ncbi:MAG: long-chain acyl-CoA synthetase [Actinomycetota bacterium]|jgi:long-chain acyl-CoA synthetase|nr:long-chain acyl-CoA synthetase [Actinomycetota bacterium]
MDGIGAWARSSPGSVALIAPGTSVTFGELDARQRALAGALLAEGLNRRDRVAVFATNRVESLEVSIGVLRAGMVPVPINSLLTEPEVEFLLEDSGARVMFTDRTVELGPSVEQVITFGDAYERFIHNATPADISDVALGRPMHYTSGTTGSPKGVWVEPTDEAEALSLSQRFRELWGITRDDAHLVCSPLAHSAPHRFSLRTLEAGGHVVLQGKFDAAETLAATELFGITTTFMVPTHLERIFGLGRQALARHDLSTMRLLAHAGAPIRDRTKREALEIFPEGSVWEFYGSTEGQATRISTEEWLARPGSVGHALPGGEVVIADNDGNELPRGEIGWVWVRDPSGEEWEYWGDAAKTRNAWSGEAFCVGDLGSVDEEGYLFLAGRGDDTIITGGVNVYPMEIENVLVSHPSVAEALVYGVAHEEWGQEVRALVVPAFNQPLDTEVLRAWARTQLAGFKCPRLIEIVDDLPRTPTGKVQRRP